MSHVVFLKSNRSSACRRAFTLIEMVVVVLILGIVAAVAVPKMFGTADTARENSTRQQLGMLRTAIELYRGNNNGEYPPGANFCTALQPYLNGPFPAPQFGDAKGKLGVHIDTAKNTNPAVASPSGNDGWVYKPHTGEIRLNIAASTTQDGTTTANEGSDW